jgi:hypothetical protein
MINSPGGSERGLTMVEFQRTMRKIPTAIIVAAAAPALQGITQPRSEIDIEITAPVIEIIGPSHHSTRAR